MDYMKEYERKLVPVEEAVKVVKSGDWVNYGEFMMNSAYLDAALAKRKDELFDVKVIATTCPFPPQVALCDPERKHFILNDWHFGGAARKLHDNDLCNYIPLNYHEGPNYYYQGWTHVDVAFIQCTPPDANGFVNLGVSLSMAPAFISQAKIVIAEVNTSVPRCLGGMGEVVHIRDIDYFVQGPNAPIPELTAPPISDVDIKIAENVMTQITDGCCLQLGIGAMPNAVGAMIAQSDLKDLGVHTEMLCDSYVDMYEAGRITGKCKQIDIGKMVYTFAMGSKKLYDFLDNNPIAAIYPVDYTNDPAIISQNDKMVCINNCLEVDLYGQVASESAGIRQISGCGGQFDFITAAYMSKGGKGLIALSSTYKDKNGNLASRIRPTLEPGTIVTVPRNGNHLSPS